MHSIAETNLPKDLDLASYAGRWVAVVRGCVTGVGLSAEQARRASKHQRPKEEPQVLFVPEMRTEDGGRKTE